MLSLSDLNAVSILAAKLNFRTAAEVLGVSTSALSRNIANVESEVGVRLFNRTTRSVSLTEAGHHFLLKIEPALSDISLAISDTRELKEQHFGTIRINADEAIARQMMSPIVATYLELYPHMSVELVSEGRLVDIVSEGFDAGVRSFVNVPKDMVAVPIGMERRMAVVASPEYLTKRTAPNSPAELYQHECIVEKYPSGRRFKWEFQQQSESVSVDVPARLIVNSYGLVLDACLAGVGIGYTGYHFAKPYIESGRLCHLLQDWAVEWPSQCLYFPQGKNITSAMKALIELIKKSRNA